MTGQARPATRGSGRVQAWYGRLPRWLRGLIGATALVLGAILIVRPTTSLGVLALLIGTACIVHGVLEFLGGGAGDGGRGWQAVAAAGWVAAGLFVLSFPGLTVRLLAVVVGAALLINGIGQVVAGLRGAESLDGRIATMLLGLAGSAFGGLALLWPDITAIVVAVVFGARLISSGGLELWRALRPGGAAADEGAPASLGRRWLRTIAAVVALALAVAAGMLSAALREGSQVTDEFYAAPRTVPDQPGQLIRSEPFTRGVPETAAGWRILYTTATADGSPAVASGLVVVPRSGAGGWPVIEWTHGTTGFAQQCAPSLLAEPFESGALFLLPDVIEQGWALVATDYLGLGTAGPHPYLIGRPSGQAALDAVRAARQLPEARLGERTVAWGHSQGGGAALWSGAIAEGYAPDVPLSGVAALAPAANLPELTAGLPEITGGSVFGSFVIAAYAALYPDVTWREYVRPGAEVVVRQMATRCLSGPGIFASVLTALSLSADPDILAADPSTGALGARLRENIPPASIGAPLLLAQGAADDLVRPAAQDAFVQVLCAAGVPVDYRRYAGLGHVPLVEPDSALVPDLIAWTKDRFADAPGPIDCSRTER